MTTKLTTEQQELLKVKRDEWIAYGLSCEPANRPEAERGVAMAYKTAGLTPPASIFWVDSPLAGAALVSSFKDGITEISEALNHPVKAGWDSGLVTSGWLVYYSSWFDSAAAIGVKNLEAFDGLTLVAKNCGWVWTYEDFAILTERPEVIHLDPQGRLHHAKDAAVKYRDGFGVYSWHGTRVPQSLIAGEWTVERILKEPNAEIRRCAIEHMGWENFIPAAGLKQVGETVPDPGNPGQVLALYDVPNQIYNIPIRVLLCANATIERNGERHRFGLTVPKEMETPIQAAAWTFSLTETEYQALERAC